MIPRDIPWNLPFADLFTGYENYPYAENVVTEAITPLKQDFDLNLACLLADLSQLVYIEGEPDIKSRLKHLEFKQLEILEHNSMRALVLHLPNCLVFVFRGTLIDQFEHILTDLRFLPRKYGSRGKVHEGFLVGIKHLWPQIINYVKSLHTHFPIIFSGHSLGGALAQLAFEHVSRQFTQTALYTFGCPRVGDREFTQNCEGIMYRLVNNNDLIAHLPPPGIYHHAGDLVYIDSQGKLVQQPDVWTQIKEMFKGNHQFFAEIIEQWGQGNFELIPVDALIDHSPLHYSIHLWNALCRK